MMELTVLEKAELEYRKTKAFLEDDLKEYKGAEYIEDEGVVGNSDKIAFHIKDMVSHL